MTPGRRRLQAIGAAVFLAAALSAAPRPACAQIRGTVTDAYGRPLPGVLVELWDAHRRLAGDGTDAAGIFRLSLSGTGPRVLLARGVGLEPLRYLVGPRDSLVTLAMQSHAIEVSGATVVAAATACPEADDPRARALWERAARHYDIELSAFGVSTTTRLFAAIVPPEHLGVIDTAKLVDQFIQAGYSTLAFATRFATERTFYAVPAARIHWRRFGPWFYPLLESTRAWHFADSLFGLMNRLAFTETLAGDTVIAFCSRLGTRPYILGRLRIAPDTTLAAAEWEFVTPSPREQAGGRVLFAPIDPSASGRPLLPVAGLFWRKLARVVYQEWMEYRQWSRCEAPGRCLAPVPLR
jgi:hypothetical protein